MKLTISLPILVAPILVAPILVAPILVSLTACGIKDEPQPVVYQYPPANDVNSPTPSNQQSPVADDDDDNDDFDNEDDDDDDGFDDDDKCDSDDDDDSDENRLIADVARLSSYEGSSFYGDRNDLSYGYVWTFDYWNFYRDFEVPSYQVQLDYKALQESQKVSLLKRGRGGRDDGNDCD